MEIIFIFILAALSLAVFVYKSPRSRLERDVQQVARAQFRARPLLNRSEAKLFRQVSIWLDENAAGLNVAPQVTYGAFMSTEARDDWFRMASKRADFVIFDDNGNVRLIIEYDGPGHYGASRRSVDDAHGRDIQKNVAAASAGIPLLRIHKGYTAAELSTVLAETFFGSAVEFNHTKPKEETFYT